MRKILAALAVVSVLAGCASDYSKYAEIQMAHEATQAERWKAMGRIAESGDTTTKVAAMFAMQSGQQAESRMIAAPRSASEQIRDWMGILIPSLVQGYGIHASQQIAVTQSNNSRDVAVSTNGTFLGIAGQIQAPAANVTTNTTTTTTDNSISGSYNPAPVTTDNSNQGNPVLTCTTGPC